MFGIFGIARLNDDRQIGVLASEIIRQFQTRLLILHVATHKRHIADNAQNVFAVFVVEFDGFIVVSREHHLGTSPHTHHGFVGIERLGGEATRLPENKIIERGENRRIEAHRVLHQKNHLNAHLRDIVFGIHFIFDEFDDSHQQIHITQPAKHIVDGRKIFVLQSARHLTGERCEHHERHMRSQLLKVFSSHKGFAHIHTRHSDDEVEVFLLDGSESRLIVGHTRYAGR